LTLRSNTINGGHSIKTFAFIFARGGSKGLPGKNVKILNGKPLIEYSIDIAKGTSEIDDVFVSTDCDIIAKVALRLGAKVIERPCELATDDSPEWLSWQHAVDYVNQNFGAFHRFVSLPATSPLRGREDIRAALNKIDGSSSDICISITPANRSPYFNMVRFLPDHSVEVLNTAKTIVNRRQDSPDVFDITTVVYATTAQYIKENQSIFSGRVTAVVVPKNRAVDIDDIYDFICAEAILNSEVYNDA
tara:strand:- start:95 stop:835 length:741 start_codon:yes stop_codon:yes gene_type:complete